VSTNPASSCAELDPAALRAKHAALVAEIEAEHAGATVLGPAHLIKQAPAGTRLPPRSPPVAGVSGCVRRGPRAVCSRARGVVARGQTVCVTRRAPR
jgi:hypothetical protein